MNIASPNDISYSTAVRAFANLSHDPEKRAECFCQEYANDVNNLYAEIRAMAKTDEQKSLLYQEIERYKHVAIAKATAYLASLSRCASSFITGPANFPVDRMRKRNESANKKLEDLVEWRKKAKESIRKKISKNASAEEKNLFTMRQLVQDVISSLDAINSIDNYAVPFEKSLFVSSIADKVERLANKGEVELVDKALALVQDYNDIHKTPAISKRHSLWNYGEIARVKRLEHDARVKSEPQTIASGAGFDVIANYEADRVQILFDKKPDPHTISALKKEGWKWSPTNNAWQRKLTEAAKQSAKRITSQMHEGNPKP